MFIYFTKTHAEYEQTLHIAKKKDYPRKYFSGPKRFIEIEDSDVAAIAASAKDAGIHVCYCDEA